MSAVIFRGHDRMAAAVLLQVRDEDESRALTQLLDVVGAADDMVRAGTVSLPVLAGHLMAVVDTYRKVTTELGRGAR